MVKPRVYVGGLPHDVSERDLEKFFKGFGRLREVLIKNGYGFVEFDDQRDADDAVYELDGEKLLGQRVTVQKARGIPRGRDRDQRDSRGSGRSTNSYRGNGRNDRFGPPTRTKHRVIVENLSSRVSWQDLKDFMRKAGEVTYADAHKEHQNEGVVEFSSHTEMKNAIKILDDSELNGRRIRIVEDRDARGGSGSRSRSRSRSYRSRSNSRSRSRSRKSVSRSKSRKSGSRSPVRSAARKSRSRSPVRTSRQRSPAQKSRSRSPVRKSRSRDYSRSKSRDVEKSSRRSKSREEAKHREMSMSRSRSRSVRSKRSNSRSRSRSN